MTDTTNRQKTIVQQTLVQRALSGHAAIGLLAGALIYIICLTGSMVVFHDRWQRWEEPSVAESGPRLSPAAAQRAMIAAIARDRGKAPTTHLYIRMPTQDLPRAVVTTDHGAWYVDGEGRIVGREGHSWTEFVIALHEYLTLPVTLGLILVGVIGVALAAVCVTGIIAHPRIFRDAFRLRTRHGSQLARADWHNRLGVWTLPFALALAGTGAIIGLGSVGTTMLAKAYTGGDLGKVYAPVFGAEPAADPAPAALPDIAAALTAMARRVPFARPTYVIAHDPGTRGQHVQVSAEHPRRLIYGETYAFDAAGNWHGPVGLADGAIGQQAAASTYNLHFGNYGGFFVELAYVLFGLALTGVTATGTTLWLRKRERRGLRSDRLAAGWSVVVWGTPLAIVAAFWVRMVAGPDAPLAAVFWALLAAGLLIAIASPRFVRGAALQMHLCWAVAATSLWHMAAFHDSAGEVLALDLVLLAAASVPLALRFRGTIAGWLPGRELRASPNRT
jgi:Uncharacterized iron-regulated membrane protein